MTVGMSLMNPGSGGWVVGGLLLAAGARILLWMRRRRRSRRAAAVAAWHPSKGPRPQWEAETMLLARVCDQLDATQLIPAQRKASR